VHVRAADALITAEEFGRMPDDGLWHELVEGRVTTMSPPRFVHGLYGGRLFEAIGAHVRRRRLGHVVFEVGFTLQRDPDTVRAPDVAFVSRARLAGRNLDAYWEGAPDLAIEVMSPGDREREVMRKVREYLAAGAEAVWVVRPRSRTIARYASRARVGAGRTAGREPAVYTSDQTITEPALLPGFRFRVSKLFQPVA
jgi:Uma2 family endonuclease